MRILVFEYITGGGFLSGSLPSSLCVEGELMQSALLRDLSCIGGLSLAAFRDGRLARPPGLEDGIEWIFLGAGECLRESLERHLSRVDAVWLIAPESDGILEGLCRIVESSGKMLLGCSSVAVSLAASKIGVTERLESCGIPVVQGLRCGRGAACPDQNTFPWVVKPDDGAGCEGIRIIRQPAEWEHTMQTLMPGREWIAQPLVEGEPLSISAIFAGGTAEVIAINRQHIIFREDGFLLQGCGVNSVEGPRGDFVQLTQAVASACPEIRGYAGIDLIRTASGLKVLEINPRLTSSYAGIHASTGINPARLVIDLLTTGKPGEPIPWDPLPVEVLWYEAKEGVRP